MGRVPQDHEKSSADQFLEYLNSNQADVDHRLAAQSKSSSLCNPSSEGFL
jgi:hypothetical protein